MTDTQTTSLSPMRWFDTLFNPTGTSGKLEFTRAWTVLFFIQLSIVVIIPFVAAVAGLLGAESGAVTRFVLYASPVVFIVTTICSYIIHTRRLRDASKPSWLAILILLPLIAGIFSFSQGIAGKSAAYDELYQERQLYLTDFPAYQEKKAEAEKEAAEKAAQRAREAEKREAEEAERLANLPACPVDPDADDNEGQNQSDGGNWNQQGPSPEDPLPEQMGFILTPNLGAIQNAIIIPSAFLAVWSLVYVARAPLPARYQHQKQGFLRLFFSPFGRIGERQFWFGLLGWVTLSIVGLGLLYLFETLLRQTFLATIPENPGFAIMLAIYGSQFIRFALIALGVVVVWAFHAILIKRLHDIGQPAWRVLFPYITAIVLFGGLYLVTLLTGVVAMQHCGTPEWVDYAQTGLNLVFATIVILYLAWVAFTEPDREDTKYGQAPDWLESTEGTASNS
ncbi:MAG: DUF805 domain-containing protein [Pseudomonadota bacterium]